MVLTRHAQNKLQLHDVNVKLSETKKTKSLSGPEQTLSSFYAKRLFQQFLVNAWAICDQNKLEWLRHIQDRLRDIVEGGQVNAANLGRRFILPSSFHGGPHFMSKLYYDSMAIVRHFEKPSLFITFTANPKWTEITDELLPGQAVFDRLDLTAEVFNLKVCRLLKDLKNIFNQYKGLVRTIEYQKRGLSHMRLLLFLDPEDNFTDADKVDQIICAKFPDKTKNPELFEIVTSCILHCPCGDLNPRNPCMIENGRGGMICSKRFPKEFQDETVMPENGYPLCRRRRVPAEEQNNYFYSVRPSSRTGPGIVMDNRWVVPYNPYLTKKYKIHINVEVCISIQTIKYVNKYVYKGSDRTTLDIEDTQDKIKKYLHSRYIEPSEAVWDLFSSRRMRKIPQ
ncbi:hypothetical protein G6F71_004979 [Rhizopus microsporus]|nr:hypothetical protein G6F71_004979 [Rhizopus microsporus]KAG1233032.1 hypothetical protein G6F67_004579 [Rhizopus microsporus]